MIINAFNRFLFIIIICLLLPYPSLAEADVKTAQVFQNEYLTVSAGIVDLEQRIVHFGDVLSLVVSVSYDPETIKLQQLDASFFTDAWPQNNGAFLLEHQASVRPNSMGFPQESHNIYKFQLMSCPDGLVLCRGTRRYDVPEFTFKYQVLENANNDENISIKFGPWPSTILVASAIPLDEDGELESFLAYFPTGAYPSPLTGREREYSWLIAGGIFLLLGGLLMSPLSFFKRSNLAASKSNTRWEQVLEKLKAGEFEDDEHFLDNLRRCMVWYCVDELGVDPFYWIKHDEEVSGQQQKGAGEYAELKELFIELVHSPRGKNEEFLERFLHRIAK